MLKITRNTHTDPPSFQTTECLTRALRTYRWRNQWGGYPSQCFDSHTIHTLLRGAASDNMVRIRTLYNDTAVQRHHTI